MLCLIINNYFKVWKPTNIRRSRAKVSPAAVRSFFEKIQPNLEDVPPDCIFNYDESPFHDDPGAEAAFFALRTRNCEQVQNHSKTSFSVMFCFSVAGDLVPPMTVYKSVTGGFYKMWGKVALRDPQTLQTRAGISTWRNLRHGSLTCSCRTSPRCPLTRWKCWLMTTWPPTYPQRWPASVRRTSGSYFSQKTPPTSCSH